MPTSDCRRRLMDQVHLDTPMSSLQEFLRDRSEPCPSCDYDLRGLTKSSCPECGQVLELRVALATPNFAPYITGIVAIGMSLGYSFMATGFISAAILPGNLSLNATWRRFYISVIATLVISTACLVVWIRLSRWLRRQRPARRWMLAVCCIALPVVDAVLLLLIGPR